MDNTTKIFYLESKEEIFCLEIDNAEIISLSYNSEVDKILTGSFDYTAKILDKNNDEEIYNLNENLGEIKLANLILI